MYLEIEILVIGKIKSKDFNSKELLTYRLKFKFSKINYQVFPLNLRKLEMEWHWKIKIYYKRSKDFKSNKPNLTLYKQNLRMNCYLFKSLTWLKDKLNKLSKIDKHKRRKLNQTFLFKKIFSLEILNNWLNSDRMKLHFMVKFKELWRLVEIFNLTLTSLINSSKNSNNYYIMLNIKFNWCNVK